ncbi:MAG: hypothetical protein RIR65_1925 [Planctomycetota bacterium]|jgi:imidazolonepropionase-like amidohydrolase
MMLATFLVLALGGGDVALRADKVWIDGSNSIDKGMVLVRDGRIVEVGAKLDLDEGVQVVECQGHLTAGLVALRAQVGVAGAALDPTRAALPEARVAHALRRDDPAFAGLRAQGITAVVVAPDAAKLLPGATAVAKTTGALVSERAHLSVVFGASALSANREPTSYARQGEMLAELFAKPEGALLAAKRGQLPILFEVQSKPELRRAIDFARERKLTGALSGAPLAGELAREIAESKLAVVVAAGGAGEPRREALATAELAKAGVPFGFGLDAPRDPSQNLRLVAALAVRHGMPRQAAHDGLTKTAASIAGLSERAGMVKAGFDADLVLWSGDPLELSSAPKAVWIEGALVHGAAR